MDTETILHTALFSGILGFAVFCASYSFQVWRSRNAATHARDGSRRRLGDRLPRWFAGAMVLGCILLLIGAIWREARPREGILSGQGLFAVRADADLTPEFVTRARTVEPGEVLARFRSPERQAELVELELQRDILETQRRVIELQPLTPDAELVRRYEKHNSDQRQLLASLAQLIPDHAVVVREKLRDALDKTERINALTTRIDDARQEHQQALARRELARQHLARTRGLSQDGAAAEIELHEKSTDNSVQTTEVVRLEKSIANMEAERKHLLESLPRFAVCTSQQAEDIGQEMSRTRDQLAATKNELRTSEQRLAQDLDRAALLKKHLLSRLDLEIRQCEAKVQGLQGTLTVTAPFRGTVAYADPAPGAALPPAPLVILAPEQGYRFRIRMPEAEVGPLSRAETVPLGFVAPVLQRRFPARLLKWEKLPDEPAYVLAEMECTPPPETIRDLVSRDWGSHAWVMMPDVKVRLLWKAPITVSPLFVPSLILFGGGLLGVLICRLRRSRCAPASSASAEPAAAPLLPRIPDITTDTTGSLPLTGSSADGGDVESGALGRNLQLLGQQFRQAIRRQQADPELLRAIEWAIDRHHVRAIRHLAAGVDHDPELPESLHRLLTSLGTQGEGRDHRGDAAGAAAQRLIRIVRAIAPDLLAGGERPFARSGAAPVSPVLSKHSPTGAPGAVRGAKERAPS